jgi:hypothetical protein
MEAIQTLPYDVHKGCNLASNSYFCSENESLQTNSRHHTQSTGMLPCHCTIGSDALKEMFRAVIITFQSSLNKISSVSPNEAHTNINLIAQDNFRRKIYDAKMISKNVTPCGSCKDRRFGGT